MNTYEITYDGNLRTSALHVDSAEMIHTDAPKDNEGLGESFSPTDLFCTTLGSCILTIMAIAARKKGIEIKGTTASVKKTMRSNPRMIDQIDVVIHFGNDFDEKTKTVLERAAHKCPVHRSISSKVKKNIVFRYLN